MEEKTIFDDKKIAANLTYNSNKIMKYSCGRYFVKDPADFKPIILDESFGRMVTPAAFKGHLLQHQEVLLRALLDFEERRQFQLNTGGTDSVIYLNSNSCYLVAPVGTGKTIIILAAIISRPIPKKFINTLTFKEKDIPFFFGSQEGFYKSGILDHTKIHFQYSNILHGSLIAVMPSVFDQWAAEIKKFTNLKVLEVSNVVDLRNFEAKMISAEINNYDIILVKNNYITTNRGFRTADFNTNKQEHINEVKIKSILYAITLIIKAADACFSWGIYDDYDSSTPPADASLPPSLFNVFVSSTTGISSGESKKLKSSEEFSSRKIIKNREVDNPNLSRLHFNSLSINNYVGRTAAFEHEILKNLFASFNKIGEDLLHTNIFSFGCSTAFVQKCVDIPAPIHRIYKIRRHDAWAIAAIGELGANTVLEMLNSDALESAASYVGANIASTPTDILKNILDKNYSEFIAAKKIIIRLKKWREEYINKYQKQQNYYFDRNESDELLNSIINSIITSGRIKKDLVTWFSTKLIQKIDETIAEKSKIEESLRNILRRFNANMSEKECPICCNALENTSIAVTKCCSLPLCSSCISNSGRFNIVKSTSFPTVRQSSDRSSPMNNGGENIISGKCPQCRSTITFPKDVCIISTKKMMLTSIDSSCNIDENILNEIDENILNEIEVDNNEKGEIIEEKIEEMIEEMIEEKEEEVIEEKEKKDEKDNTLENTFSKKIRKVWDIATSKNDDNSSKNSKKTLIEDDEIQIINPTLEEDKVRWNLYTSAKIIETPADSPKKILLFSNWAECFKYVYNFGKTSGFLKQVDVLKLHGGPHQLSSILNEFINSKKDAILFIDSMKYCAGMNIQAATHVIFMHKILDERIMTQLIGRTTRIGRTFSVKIYSLLYDME
jgi:hypothetical protein